MSYRGYGALFAAVLAVMCSLGFVAEASAGTSELPSSDDLSGYSPDPDDEPGYVESDAGDTDLALEQPAPQSDVSSSVSIEPGGSQTPSRSIIELPPSGDDGSSGEGDSGSWQDCGYSAGCSTVGGAPAMYAGASTLGAVLTLARRDPVTTVETVVELVDDAEIVDDVVAGGNKSWSAWKTAADYAEETTTVVKDVATVGSKVEKAVPDKVEVKVATEVGSVTLDALDVGSGALRRITPVPVADLVARGPDIPGNNLIEMQREQAAARDTMVFTFESGFDPEPAFAADSGITQQDWEDFKAGKVSCIGRSCPKAATASEDEPLTAPGADEASELQAPGIDGLSPMFDPTVDPAAYYVANKGILSRIKQRVKDGLGIETPENQLNPGERVSRFEDTQRPMIDSLNTDDLVEIYDSYRRLLEYSNRTFPTDITTDQTGTSLPSTPEMDGLADALEEINQAPDEAIRRELVIDALENAYLTGADPEGLGFLIQMTHDAAQYDR